MKEIKLWYVCSEFNYGLGDRISCDNFGPFATEDLAKEARIVLVKNLLNQWDDKYCAYYFFPGHTDTLTAEEFKKCWNSHFKDNDYIELMPNPKFDGNIIRRFKIYIKENVIQIPENLDEYFCPKTGYRLRNDLEGLYTETPKVMLN